jgi:hypothetical protein
MNSSHLFSFLTASLALLLVATVVPVAAVEPTEPQLAHAVYFTLKDPSPKGREKFISSCDKYLTKHKGAVSYTIGTMAEDVKEPVSDREFDVALHVVFENKVALAEYLKSERHGKFVAENKDGFAKVRVFDSYVK